MLLKKKNLYSVFVFLSALCSRYFVQINVEWNRIMLVITGFSLP